MKNQNKANTGRTQIADISVAGKELSEEHLRLVGGGSWLGQLLAPAIKVSECYRVGETCTTTWSDGVTRCQQDFTFHTDVNVPGA